MVKHWIRCCYCIPWVPSFHLIRIKPQLKHFYLDGHFGHQRSLEIIKGHQKVKHCSCGCIEYSCATPVAVVVENFAFSYSCSFDLLPQLAKYSCATPVAVVVENFAFSYSCSFDLLPQLAKYSCATAVAVVVENFAFSYSCSFDLLPQLARKYYFIEFFLVLKCNIITEKRWIKKIKFDYILIRMYWIKLCVCRPINLTLVLRRIKRKPFLRHLKTGLSPLPNSGGVRLRQLSAVMLLLLQRNETLSFWN